MSKVVLAAAALILLGGCASVSGTRTSVARIDTTEGLIIAKLDAQRARSAVCAFTHTARRGGYDDGEFFRVSPSRADEAGRISLGLVQASVSASAEASTNLPLIYTRDEATPIYLGALALSVIDERPDPGGFFIVTDKPLAAADQSQDTRFAIVGSVISGLEVARQIGGQRTDALGNLTQPVSIRSITITGRDLRCRDASR